MISRQVTSDLLKSNAEDWTAERIEKITEGMSSWREVRHVSKVI